MKRVFYIIITVFLLPVYSFNNGIEEDIRKLSNQFYSIQVPSSWEPMPGSMSDPSIPGERTMGPYNLYYFGWSTPIKSKADFPTSIGVVVESYKRKDNSPVTLQEIVDIEMARSQEQSKIINKVDLSDTDKTKRFYIIKVSKEMDESTVRHRYDFLLYKTGGMVHCLHISQTEENFSSGTEKIVNDIINSFSVNK